MTYLWCVCVIVVYNYGSVQSEVADCNTNCANLKVCPVDWIFHGKSCYYISYDLTTRNTTKIECAIEADTLLK
ncbi:Hypothetical predicted protein [Mytilus galloprovincialis]|uniref:Apple domain-containing protein n=1 Tax=Mytilus galloprovincialis TaxID=29158 RepID=A0A8B6GYT9_MYTGA|nr:Hypothetical predicted protein [Mytilus galloprovincialis]